MRIAGMQKLTLLDYPRRTAATVFTPGCNLRCPFCHNGELAEATDARALFDELSVDDVMGFLEKRCRLLDGVCISGGEPLLQPGLREFCQSLHELGYAVKIDTNGTLPARLRELLEAGLVDYVAMDVKNTPARYAETAGRAGFDTSPVLDCMRMLAEWDATKQSASCEFRTTIVRELHTREDLIGIARLISDEARAKTGCRPPWFIQNFKDSDTVLSGKGTLSPWDEDDLRAVLPALREILPSAQVRGLSLD